MRKQYLLYDYVQRKWHGLYEMCLRFCILFAFFLAHTASSVAVSAWTLVAIALERYYAICDPLRSRRWQTLRHAYKLIALIWCGSFIFMLPIAIFSQLIPTSHGEYFKILSVYDTAFQKSCILHTIFYVVKVDGQKSRDRDR